MLDQTISINRQSLMSISVAMNCISAAPCTSLQLSHLCLVGNMGQLTSPNLQRDKGQLGEGSAAVCPQPPGSSLLFEALDEDLGNVGPTTEEEGVGWTGIWLDLVGFVCHSQEVAIHCGPLPAPGQSRTLPWGRQSSLSQRAAWVLQLTEETIRVQIRN